MEEKNQSVATYKNDIAAFVDLDGTLCEIYLWQALFRHHRQLRFKRAALYAFIAFHTPLWLLYKARLLSRAFFYQTHAANLAWLVGGVTVERARDIWEWVLENETLPHLRPEMRSAIEEHKSQGHRVILLSGSFTPLLDALVARLGVERAIATPLAVKNGRYTGRIVPPLNMGRGKVERLERFLDGAGRGIDLSTSFFYTDSIVDAPVLEMFGHPVAVHPDPELANLAAARGWSVLGTSGCAIAAVLFDIGGVLYIPDTSLHRKWEMRLGLSEGQLVEVVYANPVAQRATVGEATAEEAWDHVGRRLALSPDELEALKRDMWEGGTWDRALLDFIRSLRLRYKTGTISDAWPGARENTQEYVNADVFDVRVFSAEEGTRKPDPEIYRRALSRLGVAPAEAIFVDDRLKNVEGARQVGMRTLHFTDSVGVRQEIERLLGSAGEKHE